MLERMKQSIEKELLGVQKGIKKKGGTKKYEKVIERIGRIKERNSSIARYYLINVTKEEGTDNV